MTRFGALSFALLLCLLASCALAREPSGDANVIWLLRPPAQIALVGKRMGLAKRAVALAYPWQVPCRIVTARPPPTSAAIEVLRDYIDTLNHELRHCREGAWHEPQLTEPR